MGVTTRLFLLPLTHTQHAWNGKPGLIVHLACIYVHVRTYEAALACVGWSWSCVVDCVCTHTSAQHCNWNKDGQYDMCSSFVSFRSASWETSPGPSPICAGTRTHHLLLTLFYRYVCMYEFTWQAGWRVCSMPWQELLTKIPHGTSTWGCTSLGDHQSCYNGYTTLLWLLPCTLSQLHLNWSLLLCIQLSL